MRWELYAPIKNTSTYLDSRIFLFIKEKTFTQSEKSTRNQQLFCRRENKYQFISGLNAGWNLLKEELFMYDLLFKNACLLDGTGAPWQKGDLAVKDGKIVAVGYVPCSEAKEVIDAAGMVLAPGFI